jgi:hypothetical protein
MSKEKKERIAMLQQIAVNNAIDYPKLKTDTNLIFLGSLFVELTELGGSIPKQLQNIIAESIKNGDFISAIPKQRGRPASWTTAYEICEELLTMILESKKEQSLNKHVDAIAKERHKDSSTIYKIIKKHGNMFAFLHLDFLETVKGNVPMNVRNVIETRFMNKEDKEFQDSKEFAINNLNSIKNKR